MRPCRISAAALLVPILAFNGPALAADAAIDQGREVFQKWCAMCHGSGNGMGATKILQEKYQGALPALLEERTNLEPEFIKVFIRRWNPGMPAFRRSEISDPDADALAAYLARNNPAAD
ncbi:MAG: cytochrome c [Gammaproteobacteria bacterium]|nr:MAG: cytochrome c [Gammaproteobacteria bacterium]